MNLIQEGFQNFGFYTDAISKKWADVQLFEMKNLDNDNLLRLWNQI